ncbi:hypothetical protein SLA2020_429970 [Shorea laevis]
MLYSDVCQQMMSRLNVIGSDKNVPLKDNDFLGILEKLMERLNVDELELVAMIARKIWLYRNSVVFEGE